MGDGKVGNYRQRWREGERESGREGERERERERYLAVGDLSLDLLQCPVHQVDPEVLPQELMIRVGI